MVAAVALTFEAMHSTNEDFDLGKDAFPSAIFCITHN